jgi:beta-lactam-binding protein with PASTA domain
VIHDAQPVGGTVVEEEYAPPPGPPRPRPPLLWPWILLLLLLVLGGILLALLLSHSGKKKHHAPARVVVPNVIGKSQTRAAQEVNDAGLTPQFVSKPSKFPRGQVFAEEPGAGSTVARRSLVTLSISAVSVRPVPAVTGLRTQAAIAKLTAAGLKSQVTSVAGRAPAGTVLTQSPAAGQRVGKGSTVALKVSKGLASVPDTVGQQQGTAIAALKAAGFVPTPFPVPSAEPKGTVTAQKPVGGTKAARGSKVRVNVSNGKGATAPTTTTPTQPTSTAGTTTAAPTTVTVPKVIGLNQTPARRQLRAAGLVPHVVYVPSSAPAGRVVAQTPAEGATVKSGARVRINVSEGANPGAAKTIPDVTGQDQAAATSTLQQAGFKVQTETQVTTDQSQDGVVIEEDPAAGTSAPGGSVVTIVVGRYTP